MINEETIELLVERLIRRIEQANTYFLTKMGSSIKQIKNLTPTQAQQLVQMLKYGGSYEEIISQISKYTNLNVNEIEEIFSNYAKKDQLFYEKFYKYRDIPFTPFEENMALKIQTQALSNVVKNEMYNFTRSNVLGYTIRDLDGRPQFIGLRETYNRVLDEALLNVGQGKETFDSTMTRIMKDIGGSGLKTIEYESGHSMRLDSAVRMHLKSRLRELHNENQKIIGEEIDSDGIEISVHLNPAPDHAEAQGRQFSNEEYEKLNSGFEAKDYKGKIITLDHDSKNGYRPISEMNCYHYIFSIVLGVSKPEYSDEELQEINQNNQKGFELDGKHYSMYEGTQLQRMLERRIREQKDIQTFAKASGNDFLAGESQNKITILTRKYKELSDVSGLPTKIQRMKVSTYKRSASATKTYQNEINKMKIGTFDASKFGNEFNPTTKDVILMPERKEHIFKDHPKDADKYFNRIKDVLNNYDGVYKEIRKKGTIWLVKDYDDYRLNLILKINETSLYQTKELGYKNSIMSFFPIRKNAIRNSKKSGKIKPLIDNDKFK